MINYLTLLSIGLALLKVQIFDLFAKGIIQISCSCVVSFYAYEHVIILK